MTRLVLFDIDNTLLYTGGAGGLGMNLAFQELFGISDGFANVELSGRTDLFILWEGLRQHGIRGGLEAHLQEFLYSYHHHLRRTLNERNGHLEPGFPHLLEALQQRDGVRLGLATGNFSEAAWMKLEHYGIRQYFRDGAFGEESLDRGEMVRAGIQRFAANVAPRDVLVLGDTPHDIHCAKAFGARTIAIATGGYTREQLAAHQPDLSLDDLSDSEKVLVFMDAMKTG